MMFGYKKAFTLAEVLIVLAIIGIVAAITIPALMQSTQDQELKAAWKKEFSVLESVAVLMYNDNNGDISGLTTSDDSTLNNLIAPYLKVAKTCNEGEVTGNCWHNDDQWRYLNNQILTDTETELYNSAGLILNDGTLIKSLSWGFEDDAGALGYILVDVNGFKKPNVVGKDIFAVVLFKNNIKPAGAANISGTNDSVGDAGTCKTTDTGWACSSESLYN